MANGIGDRYQKETSYDPDSLKGHSLDWHNRPDQYKKHADSLSITKLPEPDFSGQSNIWQVLQTRRSYRVFDETGSIPQNRLSALLWATQGITAKYGDMLFRTAPSAGALYPVETYLMVRAIDGLEQGIYHFRPESFDLEFLRRGDYSNDLAVAALSQAMITKAQVTFIWSAVVDRSKWKYRQRAYRYIYLDAGHIAENLYLAGEALGLGVCTIGAFFDKISNSLIGINGKDESVIYMAAVGCRKKREVKE